MVTLNTQEIDDIKADMAVGKLPADYLENHFKEEERRVFGHDFKRSRGRPVENGIGSPGRETENHFRAMRMNEQMGLEEKGTADKLRKEWLKKQQAEAKTEE
jgi:hypothetical protein